MAATNDPAPAPAPGAAGASLTPSASSALGLSSTTITPVISTVGDATVPSTVGAQVGEEQVGLAVARGAFVVLEGLDRSGKTTQVKLLQSRLIEAGRRVQLMRFPGELFGFSCVCAGGMGSPWRGGWLAWEPVGLTALALRWVCPWEVEDLRSGSVKEGSSSGRVYDSFSTHDALPCCYLTAHLRQLM